MNTALKQHFEKQLEKQIQKISVFKDEITVIISPENLKSVSLILKNSPEFLFDMLLDVCGVDYLHYGLSEWETQKKTDTGYSRGVESTVTSSKKDINLYPERFAVVYHLLSTVHNHRLRIKSYLPEESPVIDSLVDIWSSANWFEREAFDLYGIVFTHHPDLRRILTDYGFKGHPFRKDFPLVGEVEMRYDAEQGKVIYEPVSIEPRTLVPKVIRRDNRYLNSKKE